MVINTLTRRNKKKKSNIIFKCRETKNLGKNEIITRVSISDASFNVPILHTYKHCDIKICIFVSHIKPFQNETTWKRWSHLFSMMLPVNAEKRTLIFYRHLFPFPHLLTIFKYPKQNIQKEKPSISVNLVDSSFFHLFYNTEWVTRSTLSDNYQ